MGVSQTSTLIIGYSQVRLHANYKQFSTPRVEPLPRHMQDKSQWNGCDLIPLSIIHYHNSTAITHRYSLETDPATADKSVSTPAG